MRLCSVLLFLSLALQMTALAQAVRTLGLMGGSSVAFTPTTEIMPVSDFRFDVARFSMLRSEGRGLSGATFTGGLSSELEFVLRYQSAETGSDLSQAMFGIGGKLNSPIGIPGMRRSVLWVELTSTFIEEPTAYYPGELLHAALILQPSLLQGIDAHFMAGMSRSDAEGRVFFGVNSSVPLNSRFKVGVEGTYNFFAMHDWMASAPLFWRAEPNIGVQFTPGLFSTGAGATSMTLSLGVSVSTSVIEFIAPKKVLPEEDHIPSFDELEKLINEEKQNEKKDQP